MSGGWRDVPIPKHVHAIIIINLQVRSGPLQMQPVNTKRRPAAAPLTEPHLHMIVRMVLSCAQLT